MATKKIVQASAAESAIYAKPVDSKGNRRIYVDLPSALITRLNIQAASREVTKRAWISTLLADAIKRADTEAKV